MIRSIIAVLAFSIAAHAQPRTETVLPQTTDPAINGWLGAHYVAFSPSITHSKTSTPTSKPACAS